MRKTRKASGQALAESTAALCILLPIGILMILGFVNVFAVMLNSSKLNFIAMEAVKYRQDNIYWLGMKRQDPEGKLRQRADATAAKMAVQIARATGIVLTEKGVKFSEREATESGSDLPITIEECTVTPSGYRLPFAGVPGFPALWSPSVTVAIAEAPVPPPCAFVFDVCYQPGKLDGEQSNNPAGANTGILVPAYGAIWGPNNSGKAGAFPVPDMPDVPVPSQISGLPQTAVMGVMAPSCYMRSPRGISVASAH